MTPFLAEAESDTIASTGAQVIRHGLNTDYAVLIVLPVVLALLWVFIWKSGGGKELLGAIVSIVDTIKDSLTCAKEIAEIHERVINKSPIEHRDVVMSRAKNQDHGPIARVNRAASAEG